MPTSKISRKLYKHLAKEHHVSALSTYLKEIVYGGNDGIVTTFAVVSGFAGASATGNMGSLPFAIVLLFGFANLFADGISMGLGNFLSLRSEQDVYRAEKEKELAEIRNNPKAEKEETIAILMDRNFTKKQAEELTKIYSQNEDYWTEFMMKYELELANPELENPYLAGIITFSSFVLFGFIPLIPYLILQINESTFSLSLIFTVLALVLLGILRYLVTREKITRTIGEIVLIGGVAAVIAYFVGTFFRV